MIPVEVLEFLDGLVGRSERTLASYRSFAKVFFTFLDKPVKKISVKDILRFLKWGLDEQGWMLSTMRQYATLTQRFMSEFRDQDFLKELRKQVRMLPRPRRYASLYEGVYVRSNRIDDFIKAAPYPKLNVVYTMILKWGFRISETLRMALEDIDAEARRVTARGKGAGREDKPRPVWVDRPSLRSVMSYAGCSEEQIMGKVPIKRTGLIVDIAPRTVQVNWKKTAKKLNLPHWKKLTPHDGRHSYAIDFMLKRKSQGIAALTVLKNQLGHSDINTTMIYLDIAGSEARDIFEAGLE